MNLATALIALAEDLATLAPLEQFGVVIGAATPFGGSIVWGWRRGRRHVAERAEANATLRQDLADYAALTNKVAETIARQRERRAELECEQPAAMLARAAADPARAAEILGALLARLGPALATCCREQAAHELSCSIDGGKEEASSLRRARRLAATAARLTPDDDGIRRLRTEIAQLAAEAGAAAGRWREADGQWSAAVEYATGGATATAVALLNRLAIAAVAQYGAGRYAIARITLRRVVLLAERHLGLDHPDTLTSRSNLAACLESLGRAEEAEPMLRATLAALERVLGPDHPDTLTSRSNLAACLESLGRAEEAEPMLRATLAAYERVLGPDHPNTLTSRNNLAACLELLGRAEEAEPMLRATLADRERVLGPDHPDTLNSRNNLAACLGHLGRAEEAEPMLRATLAAYERVLGPDHPDTLNSRNNLAQCLEHLGRAEEAFAVRAG